jgi:hypothetical protein
VVGRAVLNRNRSGPTAALRLRYGKMVWLTPARLSFPIHEGSRDSDQMNGVGIVEPSAVDVKLEPIRMVPAKDGVIRNTRASAIWAETTFSIVFVLSCSSMSLSGSVFGCGKRRFELRRGILRSNT